jgi:hypothetical protein
MWPFTRQNTCILPKLSGPILAFRGDDRAPQDMFANGFSARLPAANIKFNPNAIKYHHGNIQLTAAGDIAAETAVCVSADFNAASLFPLGGSSCAFDQDGQPYRVQQNEDSYLYLVYVPDGYNTSHHQIERTLEGWSQLPDLQRVHGASAETIQRMALEIGFCLYGREMATKEIPAGHVLAAVPIKRRWAGNDFRHGGEVRMNGRVVVNPRQLAPTPYAHTGLTGFRAEVAHRGFAWKPLPKPADGIKIQGATTIEESLQVYLKARAQQ